MITKKKEWITTKELAKLKGVCDRAVRKSINDNKYVVRKVSRSYEILVTSLEENVREKLTEDEEKLIPKIEENYIVPEDQKQLALAKYDLVKKWNEYRYGKKDRTKAGQEFIESYNLELLYKELFQKIGKVAIGTIYDWDKKLRNYDDNWHCLIKNYSFGVKTNKKSGLSEKEEEIFLSILLHPNQIKIGKAIKLTKTILEQRGVKKFSCDMTYRRFINNYKKEHYDTWVFAREGHKALHDKVLPYITRDISKLEVGDVIIGDGHTAADDLPFLEDIAAVGGGGQGDRCANRCESGRSRGGTVAVILNGHGVGRRRGSRGGCRCPFRSAAACGHNRALGIICAERKRFLVVGAEMIAAAGHAIGEFDGVPCFGKRSVDVGIAVKVVIAIHFCHLRAGICTQKFGAIGIRAVKGIKVNAAPALVVHKVDHVILRIGIRRVFHKSRCHSHI